MSGAVLIPVKAFGQAKARLSPHLSTTQRRDLARALATAVVTATAGCEAVVHIACDDDEVAEWATEHDARVLWGPRLGLNGAIDAGIETLRGAGYDHVAVVHADLTRPEPLAEFLNAHLGPSPSQPSTPSVVIVPDRRADGTNIIIRPTTVHLPASYGPGSFRRHLQLALDGCRGVLEQVTVHRDPLLGMDIDTLADLTHPLAAHWWAFTQLATTGTRAMGAAHR
jgi:2-phospho-L-lactate guanylyltransferase